RRKGVHRLICRYKQVLHCKIATSGTAQSGHMPIVDDFHPRSFKETQSDLRWPRICSLSLNDKISNDSGRIVDAAAVGPVAGDAISSGDGDPGAGWIEASGEEGPARRKDFGRHGFLHVAGEQAACDADCHIPADRTVESRDLLDDGEKLLDR